jgi:hypothetical protein
VRFVWQTWNLEHCARHGVTRELAEAVILSPDFEADPQPDGIRAIGFGTVNGRRYRAVIQLADPDEVYVITCHPADRGGRKHRKKKQ